VSIDPTRINTFTPNNQALPAFASLSNGGFVAVWVSYEQGSNISGIYFQQYDSDGTPVGPETGVNITSYIYQDDNNPSVVGLNDGGFVIAYSGERGTQFQLYTDQGTPKGQLVNVASQLFTPDGVSSYSYTSIAALKDGGFVVTYANFLRGVAARIFDANGKAKGDEFRVALPGELTVYPEITTLSDGSFVIVWSARMFGDSRHDVFLRHYDGNGLARGDAFRIYDIPAGSFTPSITSLENGMYAVTWERGIGSIDSYVRVYSNADVPLTDRIRITDVGNNLSFNVDQNAIDSLPDGGFIILRKNLYEVPDSVDKEELIVQMFTSGGQKKGGEIVIKEEVWGSIRDWTLTVLPDGGFIVGWTLDINKDLNYDIYAKRYDADGNEISFLHENNGIWEPNKGIMTEAVAGEKIKIMADFSKAAYNLKSWENLGINNIKPFSDQAMNELGINSQEGWHSFYLEPHYILSSTEYDGHIVSNQIEDGLYVNGNAAALVARSNDAIVISFRGTNDNENYSSSISPDQKDWLNMTRHYDLMRPLVNELDVYIEMNGIKKVYVTGHSIGGAMAIKYMDDHVNGFKSADYESVVFGSASYSLYGTYDNRMTLIEIEGDAVADTGGFNGRNIHFVGNQTNGSSTAYHSMDYYRQMVDSVDNLSWEQILKEAGDQYVYIGGKMLNTDSFIVDGILSGHNSIYDSGNDTLIDPLFSDYDIYYGGRGNDKLEGGSDSELMLGGLGNDELKGMGSVDRLFGSAGSDILNGGAGGDFLYGGSGNDFYTIDNKDDIVTENSSEGTDKVNSSVTYTLSVNVENLTLTGALTINGTGNNLDNVITGNSAANQLNGQTGNDKLIGGGGDDTLTGWSGVDTMIGGLGNDSYFVENAGDVVTEYLNQGTDTVSSRLAYTLPANLENLIMTGALAINGTGNNLTNVIIGNTAANQLDGGLGDDTLDGGLGNNVLTGGAGNDAFKFTTLGHIDTITDYNVANDTIQLENAVFTALTTIGTLAAGQFRIGTQAVDANDFIIYNNATGAMLYDANGSGAGAAVQIATIGVGLAMTNAEFVII